jgi:hypothetical protein
MSAYFVLCIYLMNPYFIDFDNKSSGIILISFLGSTILFPLIAIMMMKGLGLIDSIHMREKKERVGPLLITSLFYVWSFLNFKKYGAVPEYFTYFTLGATIALFASFFVTLFDKVSLHSVAFSSLIAGLYIIKIKYKFYEFIVELLGNSYLVNTDLLIALMIVIWGIIASSRLYLNEHNPKQIYMGAVLGVLAMFSASLVW